MGRREDEGRRTNYLRDWREHRQLTQAQLAAIIGTEGSVISLLESGDRGLSDKWLHRLAPALHTTPGMLLDHHPDNISVALMETWAVLPEDRRADVVRQITADAKRGKSRETPPEESGGEVVKLPTARREQSKVRKSKPIKAR
jgi:transcriptional regulator with XRE-family HTH domain